MVNNKYLQILLFLVNNLTFRISLINHEYLNKCMSEISTFGYEWYRNINDWLRVIQKYQRLVTSDIEISTFGYEWYIFYIWNASVVILFVTKILHLFFFANKTFQKGICFSSWDIQWYFQLWQCCDVQWNSGFSFTWNLSISLTSI